MKKVDFNKLQAGDLVEVPRTQFAPMRSGWNGWLFSEAGYADAIADMRKKKEQRRQREQAKKACRWYFIKQKAYGLAMLAVTVLAAWATEGDITIAVITVPLGLMCLFSKKMLIVDNYYFATEERAIHGRKNNTAY